MQIDLSPTSVNSLIQEKQHLIEREAKRMFSHFYVKTGVIDYDDFLQVARQGFIVTLDYFNKSKYPLEAFDAYIVLGIQGELKNWIAKTTRQFNYTFDIPEQIENIPENPQDLLPMFDDLEVLSPLSDDAQDFLKCIFTPPTELATKIKEKVGSGKPYSKNILPVILEFLSIGYDQYNEIKNELVKKCKYMPSTTQDSLVACLV
jgi:hypothetical protein